VKIARRSFIRGVATWTVLASVRAAGERTNPLPRVAFVYAVPIDEMTGDNPTDPRTRAFVHGLRDLGLVEGRNIIIERRSNEGSPERYPALMQEVVGCICGSTKNTKCFMDMRTMVSDQLRLFSMYALLRMNMRDKGQFRP
jgi:hypothetical protein